LDGNDFKIKILGAIFLGVVFGTTLVILSLNFNPFLGPSDPPQDYPILLIGIIGFTVAVVAYVIAKLHYQKQSWI